MMDIFGGIFGGNSRTIASESLSVFRKITIRPSEEVLNLYRLVSSLQDPWPEAVWGLRYSHQLAHDMDFMLTYVRLTYRTSRVAITMLLYLWRDFCHLQVDTR